MEYLLPENPPLLGAEFKSRPATCNSNGINNSCKYEHTWFDSFYVHVSTNDGYIDGHHILRYTPTNGHRFTALSLPRRSPINVLTEVDVALLQWMSHWAVLCRHRKPKLITNFVLAQRLCFVSPFGPHHFGSRIHPPPGTVQIVDEYVIKYSW